MGCSKAFVVGIYQAFAAESTRTLHSALQAARCSLASTHMLMPQTHCDRLFADGFPSRLPISNHSESCCLGSQRGNIAGQ
jgi:hypothetical protein